MGRMPIPDDQNPSAADELRCNKKKHKMCCSQGPPPLNNGKETSTKSIIVERDGHAPKHNIASTCGGCAISPDKIFTMSCLRWWFGSSMSSRRCGNIAGYPTHNHKAARTMIGLRGQRCRTASANGIVYRYRSLGLRRRWRVVCCVCASADQKMLLCQIWGEVPLNKTESEGEDTSTNNGEPAVV